MRITDWSADECSSDLVSPGAGPTLSAIWLAPRFSYSCPLLHRKSRLCCGNARGIQSASASHIAIPGPRSPAQSVQPERGVETTSQEAEERGVGKECASKCR